MHRGELLDGWRYILTHPQLRGVFLNTLLVAALLLAQPPSLDAGEITDKGYLNQRRTLECRAADVARLYAEPADRAVISGTDG